MASCANVSPFSSRRSPTAAGALTPIEVLAPATYAQRVAARFRLVKGVSGAVAPGGQWQRDGTDVLDVLAVADNSSAAGEATMTSAPARVMASASSGLNT